LRDYAFEFQFEVREVVQIFSYLDLALWTLPEAIIFDRFCSHMPNDDFGEVQRQLEAITLELKNATDPERRRTLLREMSRLVGEAERISSQPPKMLHKPGQP
jgi:hypothetical protein